MDDLVKRLDEASKFNVCHSDGSPDEAALRDAAYNYGYLWLESKQAIERLSAQKEAQSKLLDSLQNSVSDTVLASTKTIDELRARIAQLESDIERFTLIGVEAYDIACEEMEAFQRKRAEAGKEVGTTGSLVDGMSWVYSRLDAIESENAVLKASQRPAFEFGNPAVD